MMTLNDFLKDYEGIRLATNSDNQKLTELMADSSMKGESLVFSYDRSPDFFSFLKCHSEKYFVFVMESKQNEILGFATIVIREGVISGDLKIVAYLGDLRMFQSLKAMASWKRYYGELIQKRKEIFEFSSIDYFYTVIIDKNKYALKVLLNKKARYEYHLLERYKMVNIIGKWPQLIFSKSKFTIENLENECEEEVQAYWISQSMKREFGHPQLLSYALKCWPSFSKKNIWVARDTQKKIVGMAGVWSPESVKKIIVKKLPIDLTIFGYFWSMFRPFLKINQTMNVVYVTHLTTSEDGVLSMLLEKIWNEIDRNKYCMLCLTEYEKFPADDELKKFITQKIPMSLYQVTSNGEKAIEENAIKYPPGFEMALV